MLYDIHSQRTPRETEFAYDAVWEMLRGLLSHTPLLLSRDAQSLQSLLYVDLRLSVDEAKRYLTQPNEFES